jgi:hypothetical protein
MPEIRISQSIYKYQVGGSLQLDASSYITRQADSKLYQYLKAGEFCYVLSSRQAGKSSLRVRTKNRLQQEGFACASLDLTNIGSSNITPQQWYKGIAADLWRSFNLTKKVDFFEYWLSQAGLPPVQVLSRFIEDILLSEIDSEKIFIFIDEIDSVLSLDFPGDDFFALIRCCYDRRADIPVYRKLNFALFGAASPSKLIKTPHRTPFNIGREIELEGFELTEALLLAEGLEGKVSNPEAVVKSILTWTGGQPFLTQKLCQLALKCSQEDRCPIEAAWIETLVKKNILENWESQDEPEHLKTIRDRLCASEERAIALLGLYQQILYSSEKVTFDGSPAQMELLLSGIVTKRRGNLEVYNPIYQAIFNPIWLGEQLVKLRIYADSLDKWLNSERSEHFHLLRGKDLQDAQVWAIDKILSNEDYQFLSASQALDRQEFQQSVEKERLKETQARLAEARKNARIQKLWLIAVSISLAIAVTLGLISWREDRQAKQEEIKSLAKQSQALLTSNRNILALIEAIAAQKQLYSLGISSLSLKNLVEEALQQAVEGAIEYNCFAEH